ncbi:MAG: VCBS repeat-containing protein [Rhodobacteraceae bacterium]|nr:VCBS repeat-containing protein [Paracoccaceae bacterium]
MNIVLPEMGARLGFQTFRGTPHPANPNAPEGIYAAAPMMDRSEWAQIIAWYEDNAPQEMARAPWRPHRQTRLFTIDSPESMTGDFPTSTAIFIDEQSQRILVGDSYELTLETYSPDLELLEKRRSGGAISRIRPSPTGGYLATIMGGNIGQSELLLGLLIDIDPVSETPVTRLVRRLHRPVDVKVGDFNSDGASDYVIAEFGTYFGKLSLHLSQPDGSLHETVLLNDAGTISVSIIGNDLLVLIAQGDERIIRVNNFASQTVTFETLLRFPPSQGSSSLRSVDVNGDGIQDLLYTAGDNADISPIYKPYHGIYVFAGQPDGSFVQEMFFHLDGTYDAIAADFDQDGDMDIAAISYFPNIDQNLDEVGFVYLQNTNGNFDPQYVKGLGALGRFIALSVGDIDADGDLDIALANLAFGPYGPLTVTPELQDRWLAGPRFILLRNGLH